MGPSNNQENKIPSDIYWRVQLVCIKVQVQSSLEPPLEYNQDKLLFPNQMIDMIFLTNQGVTEILCSFRLVLEGKRGKEIPEPSRLEFLENFLPHNFALSDGEDNISRPLNRVDITGLPWSPESQVYGKW